MNDIITKIEDIDWRIVSSEIHEKGYIILPDFLSTSQCEQLTKRYDNSKEFRKTVEMKRYRFGLGEYKYFNYPLPNIVQIIRENIYPKLVPIANLWMESLKIDRCFPESFQGLQEECRAKNQTKPTALILKYGKGGFNTLHQDLYGEIYFPLQLVLFLNEPDVDYTGGEFVLTQQTPRAQSKAIVLKPRKGSMLILTTNFRPLKGVRGYYRVSMKHGVSELHGGKRYTLGIIFHDAIN